MPTTIFFNVKIHFARMSLRTRIRFAILALSGRMLELDQLTATTDDLKKPEPAMGRPGETGQ